MKENLNKNKIQSVDFACVKFTKVRKKLNGQSYIMNSFEIKEIAMWSSKFSFFVKCQGLYGLF